MENSTIEQKKLTGWELYEKLNKPKFIMAPMVDQSEYAWRLLCRRYNTNLCYSPMLNAKLFCESVTYREQYLSTGLNDYPLVIQFCANNPEYLLKAALLVQDLCVAVDINLGCPQHIAKRGRYGSFLMEDPQLISELVKILHLNLKIPVTCKIRIFPDINKTLDYAKMLQDSGCQILTVHGRTRDQKGHKTGLADWKAIKRVKEALSIPVFANGNILYYEDIENCLKETGVDGVMAAEGNLYNPALFANIYPHITTISREYLNIVKDNPKSASMSMVRAHLFKMFNPCLKTLTDLRSNLAKVNNLDDFFAIVDKFEEALKPHVTEFNFDLLDVDENGFKKLPIYVCQPYFRPPLVENKRKEKILEDELKKSTVKNNTNDNVFINENVLVAETVKKTTGCDVATKDTSKDEIENIVAMESKDDAEAVSLKRKKDESYIESEINLEKSVLRKSLVNSSKKIKRVQNDGRDKILKCVQYAAKFLVSQNLVKSEDKIKKLKNLASQFSITRKILRLIHFLDPLEKLMEIDLKDLSLRSSSVDSKASFIQNQLKFFGAINCLVGFTQDVIDDFICLSKLGALEKSWQSYGDLSDRLWLTTIHFDLLEAVFQYKKLNSNLKSLERQIVEENEHCHDQKTNSSTVNEKKINQFFLSKENNNIQNLKIYAEAKDKLFLQKTSILKLIMDLIFCSYDVFGFEKNLGLSETWQLTAALISGFLSTYKLAKKTKL
ncbi:hypothetical protein HDU92_002088 [Lobulomyces angularis]|nr:hypothetical protein HDU92_002088 [Lobulomyces angularis]